MTSHPPLFPGAHIAFLHTSPLHVATFDRLLSDHLPTVNATHIVDVSLLDDVRRDGPTTALRERLGTQLERIAETSPDLIVCTCSSIGPLAEGTVHEVAVIRLDRPMAEAAIRIASTGNCRIGVAATVESTVQPTSDLLNEAATARGLDMALTVIPCFHAWSAFEASDTTTYAVRIADAVRQAAAGCDVIVLAQASMAVAVPLLSDLPIPVLASPSALIEALATAVHE